MQLVISGIGPLSPLGAGKDNFWRSLSSRHSGINHISKFSSVSGAMGGEINNNDIDGLIDDRKFRRAAEISKYALAAIKLAILDANSSFEGKENTAIITAVTHGAMNYTQDYHESLITGGVEDISPILFSESVLNAPAGNASICYGVQGVVHTIVGGCTASLKAVMLASRILNEGAIEKAIVVSAEEVNELSFYCRGKFGESIMSEGAGALLIENNHSIDGSKAYCHVSGFSSYFEPKSAEASFVKAIDQALTMANINKNDLDLALIDIPKGMCMRYLDEIPSGTVSQYTGNAYCVSSAWNIIIAAHIIKKGMLPDNFIKNDKNHDKCNNIKHVLICNLEETGHAAAVVLSKAYKA